MKLMIASDLHGSAYYAGKLLDAFRAERPGKLLLLGDLLYHGPRNALPREYDCMAAAERLNSIKNHIVAVRGNCDCEVDQMVLEFPILADYALLSWEGADLFATHGHNYGPGNPPPLEAGDFLLCGHTHLPVRRDSGGFTYLNPGSLSLPKEGTPHSYMTLEGGVFTWHDLFTGETFEPLR